MSTETQLAEKPKKPATIKEMLQGDQFKAAISAALPKHLSAERFIRIAITAMTRTPKLATCDQGTFFQSLLTLSQCGIEPDGRRAYLIPFENRKRGCTECQLIISYMGLLELAMRSGEISNVHADKVCENDEFEYDRGQILKHKIDFRKPRGKAYAYYSVARFKDGTEKSEVMPSEDIEGIRKRSKAANAGPWVTDYDEMSKKTVFRRLSKWLPLSPEFRDALDKDADSLALENAKPIYAHAVSNPVSPFSQIQDTAHNDEPEDNVPMDDEESSAAAAPTTQDEIPAFVADTPQKQIAQAVKDFGCMEAAFMATCRKMNKKLVGGAALISELSDESAEAILNEINSLLTATEEGK